MAVVERDILNHRVYLPEMEVDMLAYSLMCNNSVVFNIRVHAIVTSFV